MSSCPLCGAAPNSVHSSPRLGQQRAPFARRLGVQQTPLQLPLQLRALSAEGDGAVTARWRRRRPAAAERSAARLARAAVEGSPARKQGATGARENQWEARYAELEEYKVRFGDCNVPSKWEENRSLGAWVMKQRVVYKKGALEASKQQRLEGLGLVWDAVAAVWEARYTELEEYKARFGDCNVPRGWEESPQLGTWVQNQRTAYKKSMLEASKQERLEGLGLMWDALAAEWEARYAEMEEYKARFGDCNVSRGWEENRSLGEWVSKQRKAYKKGALEASRQERLEGLGLVWDSLAAKWESRYAELEGYRAQFGDCNVPWGWEENLSLSRWATTQRGAYKKGTLEVSKQQRLEGLGFVWDPFGAEWEARYAELEEYRARFGDCNVPSKWEESPQLSVWVSKQRVAYKKGSLEASKLQRLEGLGFVWDAVTAMWEARYAELEEYKARFGDCNVSTEWEENRPLGQWVHTQRQALKKGTMEASWQERLAGLGFVWDPFGAEWEARYAELEEYRARLGDCNVPSKWEENPQLGTWVSTQRRAYKKGALVASRLQRLEGLGFVWDAVAETWEARCEELEEYKARVGDCNVPQGWEESPQLGAWVNTQRVAYKKGSLEASRQRRLEGLGLVWEPFAAEWEARYAELEEYKARFLDCMVPTRWEESPQLSVWVSNQRDAYKKGSLEATRQERLEGLGLVWEPFAAEWEARYAELEEYRARFGDCMVPSQWEEDPSLGTWVTRQRQVYKAGALEAPRQQRLEGLGFVWDPYALEWEARFAELEEYRARFGDCNVPRGWEESPQLGAFVRSLRQVYKAGTLEASRQERLEGLGFVWKPYLAGWEARYEELEEYKDRFGDCLVPKRWEESPPLGRWVKALRDAYKKGKLEATRQQRLEGLGFVWEVRSYVEWEARCAELERYRARFGDCNVPKGWEESPSLGGWVSKQRKAYKKGALEAYRQERLEGLRFVWEPRAAGWQDGRGVG